MKDLWILMLTASVMILVMLTGRLVRGDFVSPAFTHAPVESTLGSWAAEQDGQLLININAVDAETLTRIDGIGEVLSERIVVFREEYGPFSSLDELIKVDGIGTKTLQRIRSRLICPP